MKKISFVLLLSFTTSLFASVPEMSRLFGQTFTSNYVPGRCGDNIFRLVSAADNKGLNYYNANILIIENLGLSVFGMLNVEWARLSGALDPAYPATSPFRSLPGERNWYHHIVLEMDGVIYDYDFGNTPQVLSKADYFDKMFLKELKKDQGGKFYVGLKEKLTYYQVEVIDAREALRAKQTRIPQPKGVKMSLDEYLKR